MCIFNYDGFSFKTNLIALAATIQLKEGKWTQEIKQSGLKRTKIAPLLLKPWHIRVISPWGDRGNTGTYSHDMTTASFPFPEAVYLFHCRHTDPSVAMMVSSRRTSGVWSPKQLKVERIYSSVISEASVQYANEMKSQHLMALLS